MTYDNELVNISVTRSTEGIDVRANIDDYQAMYGGFISTSRPEYMSSYALTVDPSLRGKRLGELLARKVLGEAASLGVSQVGAHIESQYALDIAGRIFGKEPLSFYDDPEDGVSQDQYPERFEPLPITFEQARQSLERAAEFEADQEFRFMGFHVVVDMDSMPGATQAPKPDQV